MIPTTIRIGVKSLLLHKLRTGLAMLGIFIGVTAVLDLQMDTEIGLALVRQPASYQPTPFELMPPEQLLPPKDFDVELVIR